MMFKCKRAAMKCIHILYDEHASAATAASMQEFAHKMEKFTGKNTHKINE